MEAWAIRRAKDLGNNPGTLGNWVNQDKVDSGEVERLDSDERAELARLRQEVTELRMERDGLIGLVGGRAW